MSLRGASSWFKTLFGTEELRVYQELKDKFALSSDHSILKSLENGKVFHIGKFTTPTLQELRNESKQHLKGGDRKLTYEHIVAGDAFPMHYQYPNAVFQAASQFNCLEFSSSKTTPERGVEIYQYDNTQGPACAMACAAGTVYRNYFVDVDALKAGGSCRSAGPFDQEYVQDTRKLGQTIRNQLNNLDELEALLHNYEHNFWYLENGYTFSADLNRLLGLNDYLDEHFFSAGKRDELLARIKIGVHSNVGVTFQNRYTPVKGYRPARKGETDETLDDVRVTQTYCSALSCAYAGISNLYWAPLARLVLDAAYESTLWAAVIHAAQIEASVSKNAEHVFKVPAETTADSTAGTLKESHHRKVFLTFLGGGVFGNDKEWISSAIGRALAILAHSGAELSVSICHYRNIDATFQRLIDESYQHHLQQLEEGKQV